MHCKKKFCGESSPKLHMTESHCDTKAEIISTEQTHDDEANDEANAFEVSKDDIEEELYMCNICDAYGLERIRH